MTSSNDSSIVRLRNELDDARSKFGDEHATTMGLMKDLSSAYRGVGDYQSAIPLLWDLLTAQRRSFGDWNSEIIITTNALGIVLYGVGDYERSIEVLTPTLQASRVLCGDGDDTSILVLRNLLAALGRLGRFTEFAEAGNEIIDARLLMEVNDDERTLNNLAWIAGYWRRIVQYEQSKRLYKRIIRECTHEKNISLLTRAIFDRVALLSWQGIVLRLSGDDAEKHVHRHIQRMNAKALEQHSATSQALPPQD